jgi:hypothetical protein
VKKYLNFVVFIVCFSGCVENIAGKFELPDECEGRCTIAGDINSLHDAVLNSSAAFSKCICFDSGEIIGDIIVAKPLFIVGRKDGTSRFKGSEKGLVIVSDDTVLKNIGIYAGKSGVTIHNSKNVKLIDIDISGISVKESALKISGSSVVIKSLKLSNIGAGSLFGGRGVLVTGEKSEVTIEDSVVDRVAGTGLLINNSHTVTVNDSHFSKCGFAGVWVQNGSGIPGMLTLKNSKLSDNGSVALQVLGESDLRLDETAIKGVGKREINLEMISDGIVIKNRRISKSDDSVAIKGVEISGYERAGIILDGVDDKMLTGVVFEEVKILSQNGSFGVVVQNARENKLLREGIDENPFTEKDISLSEPLFIIETFQE